MNKLKQFLKDYFYHVVMHIVMMLFLSLSGTFFYSVGMIHFSYLVLLAIALVLLGLLFDLINYIGG
tara:strand:- start:4966 stop:5163 length:198 start_codon:yes stop_codon:yes gene_type:complete